MGSEQSDAKQQQEQPTGMRRFWRNWIKPILVAVLVVTSFRSAVADWNDVPTPSMEPNILVGDRIFVNKLAYDLKVPFTRWRLARWAEPDRGDIVVFFHPENGKRMVKRVIGLPGDRVNMRDNRLYINGQAVLYQPLNDPEVSDAELTDPPPHLFRVEKLDDVTHAIMVQPSRRATRDFSMTVEQGQYLMLGDNRDNSGDSRVFGLVDRDLVVGKVVGLAFSLDHDNNYLPRWERFGRGVD